MRRGSIVALLGIGLVAGGVATAVALIPTWLPVDASRAGRPHRLPLLGRDRDLHRALRDRRRGDDLLDRQVQGRAGRPRGRPARSTGTPGSRSRGRRSRFVLVTAIAIVCAHRPRAERRARRRIRSYDQRPARSSSRSTFSYPERGQRDEPRAAACRSTARSSSTCARSTSSTRSSCRSSAENEDIVPGLVTHLHITPDRLGTYPLELQRALRARALADAHRRRSSCTDEAFDTWIAQQKAGE